MEEKLYKFTDNLGSFESKSAHKQKTLYFPLANENLVSSVSPDLHGDITCGQNSFLLEPVSRIDLVNSRASRNFWVYIDKDKVWSATGVSKDISQIKKDTFKLEAGLLWHKITRQNRRIGLKAEILSFIPAGGEPVEIMQVTLTNLTSRSIQFTPTAAIPLYARSADNIRNHRHVTSLLQRISLHKYGVISKPTLVFDEKGHRPNKENYFVLGWEENQRPPQYIYPTQESFCGDAGDLEAPESILENSAPLKTQVQGRDAFGGLRFHRINLAAKKSRTYIILMGITQDREGINRIIRKFNSKAKIDKALVAIKEYWSKIADTNQISSGDKDFDHWFRWVSIQPTLRRIFGCSFLPDFDYGKGGRGWRDLWQDCLSLILNEPQNVRKLLINNFSGIRIDGSNATIIGNKSGEFISDRDNISRKWMDHGVWPLLTLDLYINETGDYSILFERTGYFCDRQISRKNYQGTTLEHLLVQNLVQFFNVGAHNHIRLEGADWNDGLDMAKDKGESVAFSCMYAYNLERIAGLLLKSGGQRIELAEELKMLLGKVNYASTKAKTDLLSRYFSRVNSKVSGKKIELDSIMLAENLKEKSQWIKDHIRKEEWLAQGFFNGYYDNKSRRVEGKIDGRIRMSLYSQVFQILSNAAYPWQVERILKSADKYLFDKTHKSYHLNSDFGKELHDLGRAFSFVYGDKENGAFFNHMSVMFAYALYKQGLAEEGWKVLSSIYNMAVDTAKSKIYPCLPEYFNLQGNGMYSYLTGSASWFVLTMLTQAFGIRGEGGDLLIEPKFSAAQFKDKDTISVQRIFAGRKLRVEFSNPRRLCFDQYKIGKAVLNAQDLVINDPQKLDISRAIINSLPKDRIIPLKIILG